MFGKITDYTLEGQKLVIRFEEREGVIEAVTDEIINVFSGFPEYDHADRGKIIALFGVIGTCDRGIVALLFQGAAAR